MPKISKQSKGGPTITLDTENRDKRSSEKSYAKWDQAASRIIKGLQAKVLKDLGREMTELEAFKFVAFSQETGVARIYWVLDNDPELLDVLKGAAYDAYERYAAHLTGSFKPPRGSRFESPKELDDQLKGIPELTAAATSVSEAAYGLGGYL